MDEPTTQELTRLGPGGAGGTPSARAFRRIYADVNGDSRSTSVGVTPARRAANAAASTACRASSWADSVSRYLVVAAESASLGSLTEPVYRSSIAQLSLKAYGVAQHGIASSFGSASKSDAPAAGTAEASGPHQSLYEQEQNPMSIIHLSAVSSEEPSPADLAGIEQEWPLISAELDLLDAQIAFINAGPYASELETRRIRRAQRRVLEIGRELADREPDTEVVA
ncbi:DUF6284 family protein [Kribbella sp. NPDC003557]|uniref:DUF6284 family protein n=1 Tax=Kribbella sp. NPDC003557 TaxID=3154449 RepID=UPI0033A0FC4C